MMLWKLFAGALGAIFVLGILLGIILGGILTKSPPQMIILAHHPKQIQIKIPAVDRFDRGVIASLNAKITPGTGEILVKINDVLAGIDVQESARIAAKLAADYSGMNFSNFDYFYSIQANADVVEGPSAGAAMAIATIALLKNLSLREDVMITGTISPDGRIGAVGGIPQKAHAAKSAGSSIFLIPEGQNIWITTQAPSLQCEQRDSVRYCKLDFTEKRLDLGQLLGLELVEVSNIDQALRYFTK